VNAPHQLPLFHVVSLAPSNGAMQTYCRDCSEHVVDRGEYSMVRDNVWPIEPYGGVLCVGCLEARLGRRLIPDDSPTFR
jgi:hypothetical protein